MNKLQSGRIVRLVNVMVVLALAGPLAGCVAAAVNTSTLAVKALPRAELSEAAEAGDAQAQYKLGRSLCCMGPGFDTQKATAWYCKAAMQGNADAMFELGRIYLGEISRTPAPGQKVLRAVLARESPAHAHMWLSLATAADHEDAAAKLERLDARISDQDRSQARALAADWQHVPCEYDAVFASK